MTGGEKSTGAPQQKGAGGFFAGMYDSGGYIPRGQVCIAGENGPELINGPAYVTSRRRTAALASIVAGMMGGSCRGRTSSSNELAGSLLSPCGRETGWHASGIPV